MGSIVDAFARLVLDDSGFQADVIKSADTASKGAGGIIGKNLSASLKTGAIKLFGATAAAAFATATRGALQLEDVQVELQRSTGLTADAAKEATKALNGIAGRNVTDINDVAAAFEKVHNDLGLTGQAALDTTEAFVRFGRATKQGPSDAVKAFDDILDAWSLTADHSQEIMDKLVVSNQRYGGSIEEDQLALKNLGPQLRALNVDIDGGIGLLNLFKVSGLDSSKALFALNSAVKNLKPGQTLDDLIRQVSSIEDPTKRAQKAIEIFGARGGVALANVLKPGINSLADFEVSATDAGGATQRAADALDSSVRGKIAKALSIASAKLREFGADFGPAVTGIASLATITATVFPGLGGKIAKGLGGALRGLIKSSAVTSATALVGGYIGAGISTATKFGGKLADAVEVGVRAILRSRAVTAAAGAVGTVVGGAFTAGMKVAEKIAEVISEGLSAILEKAGIKTLAAEAGSAIGTIFGTAMGAVEKIAEPVAGALSKLAGSRVVLAAAGTAGQALGVAIGAGIIVGIPALLVAKGNDLRNAITDVFNKITGLKIAHPEDLYPAPPPSTVAAVKGYGDALGQVDPILAEEERQSAEATRQVEALTAAQQQGAQDGAAANKAWQSAAVQALADVNRHLKDNQQAVTDWRVAFRDGLFKGINDARTARTGIDGQFDQLLDDLKNFGTRSGRIGHDIGQLTSKELAKALHSGIPEVRQEAEGVQLGYLDEISKLVRSGDKIGKKGMDALRAAIHSKNPEIARVASEILATIQRRIDKPSVGTKAGNDIGGSMATAIYGKAGAAGKAAAHLAAVIRANLPTEISTTIKVAVNYSGHFRGLAAGGHIDPGETVMVGERAPELATGLPGGGAFITPLHSRTAPQFSAPSFQAPRLFASSDSGGISIGSIALYGVGSDVSPAAAKRFGRMVGDEVAANFRQQGRRVGLHAAVRP